VPDVVGRQQGEAIEMLRAAGFDVVKRTVSTDASPGLVTGQSPPAGTVAQQDSTVYITVAK
jgi:beta-lactam-binding protein with PASTA domain